MKKLSFLLATLSLGVATLAGGGLALAEEPCSISHTGPDSTNICESTTTDKCVVTNENDIDVDNSNKQNAGSGDATNSDNTSGGSAASGSASNSNDTSVSATITNGNACQPAATQPTTSPVTPGRGGAVGAEQVTPVTPAQSVTPGAGQVTPGMGQITPSSLPNTSAVSPLITAALVATVSGILLTVARFALRAYIE